MKFNFFTFWIFKLLRELFGKTPPANATPITIPEPDHIDSTFMPVPHFPVAESTHTEHVVEVGDLPDAEVEKVLEEVPGPSEPVAKPLFVWALASIRNDRAGKGTFLACRGGDCTRKHKGVDFIVKPGMLITSPVDGWYVRVAFPYKDAPQWKGVVLKALDGTEVKIFYCDPQLAKGTKVRKGQVIAQAMDISKKYPGQGMLPHIHVEATLKGNLLNPIDLFVK